MTVTSQSLILKRSKSGQQIDLTAAPYSIGRDFAIPTINESVNITSGSSANIYGGGTLASLKYNDRTWTFEIRILSTTEASVRYAARRVVDFLLNANPNDPAMIEYRSNTDTPEPLWGQYGSALRFEVINATTTLNVDYADYTQRERVAWLTINAVIKPYAVTKQQQVCTATGGIAEDMIGSTDGRSKGLLVPEALTLNRMTNPVFGHATWNNGWTAGANITATQNIDERWLLPGTGSSALLTSISGSFGDLFTQSINAGNTNAHSLSCYAKRHDGAAVSSSDLQLYYNTSLTTTYTAIGNGWYRLTAANFSGINGATNTGVNVSTRHAVYVTGFQLEEKAYCTVLAWGDLPGCAWTGTAHASTSSRTAASCKIAIAENTVSHIRGSIRCIVRFDVANTHSNDMVLFEMRDGSNLNAILIYFEASDDKITVTHSGTSEASAALTFSAGAVYIVHVTFTDGNLSLYVNGSLADSGSYTTPTAGANIFIGSDYGSSSQIVGALLGVTTFDVVLTATEVLNDYNNITALTSGYKVGDIPWFWTDDGDGILALDTGKTQLGIVGGIAGNMAALTEMQGALSSVWSTIKGIVFSNFASLVGLKYTDLLNDQSGTANAGAYGGEHFNTTVTGAADVIISGGVSIPRRLNRYLNAVEYYTYMRLLASAGSTVSLYPYYIGGVTSEGSARIVTLATGYRLMRTNVHTLYTNTGLTSVNPSTTAIKAEAYLSTGSITVSVDYIAIFPRPCLVLTSSAGYKNFALNGQAGYVVEEGTTNTVGILTQIGDRIEFMPHRYNHLQCLPGADESIDPVTTYTVTISSIYITPRWALL